MFSVIKVFFVTVFIFSLNLSAVSNDFAKKYNYMTDYDDALEKAKNLNKPIMMVLSTKSCPWCRKLERQTLKKDIVQDIVSKDFIALAVDRDYDDYPYKFRSKVVPTVVFIDPKSEEKFSLARGYKNKRDFRTLLLEVKTKFNK